MTRARLAALAAAVSALTLIAGCSSSTSGSGTASSTSPSSAPTAGTSSPTPTATATPAPDLKSQVLAITDLPTGWSVDNSSDSGAYGSKCINLAAMTKGKSTDNADASFVQGGSGLPSLDENLAYFPGATAATTYAKITKSLQSCGQISISSDGTTLKGSIGAMSFPKVGDESNAYSVDLTADGLNVTVDLVTLMKGNELCTVDYLDLGDVDVSDFETYVNLAVGKLT